MRRGYASPRLVSGALRNSKPDLKWLIIKMATLPITRQDWAFVFEVNGEEATKIAWKFNRTPLPG